MRITLNGAPRDVSATRLDDILAELGYGEAKIATAVNEDFVAIALRTQTFLTEHDRLEIVAPQQGG